MKTEMNLLTACQSSNIQLSSPIVPSNLTMKQTYKSMLNDLTNDSTIQKEITLGERIGFYKICEQIGSGSFSKVNLGRHCLINGLFLDIPNI
ncbi:hypothetical protein LOAG_15879 [Loa loa]|uniref:Protein kinase domain-containing protein n=1 Tax=Loa loa TaxID=7209 RepID=A0A1S0TF55_LOALO|nr:hypothetical protein LOAG_15879 [Loa loa]EFO12654.1 hypothetical protein LOAG_15879 [Loa loa]